MESKKGDRAKKCTTAKRGRPGLYSKAAGVRICEAYAMGEPLESICRREGVNVSTVYRWREKNADFCTAFARARGLLAESIEGKIDMCLELASVFARCEELGEELRLRAVDRVLALAKFRLSSLDPARYGTQRQEIRQELTGRDGAPLVPPVPALTEERLAHIAELQARFTVQLEQERAGEDKLGEAQDGFAG